MREKKRNTVDKEMNCIKLLDTTLYTAPVTGCTLTSSTGPCLVSVVTRNLCSLN